MGSAESKVAAQPLAVVASAGATGSSDRPGRFHSTTGRPSGTASGWTCNLLRKQNKTAPAAANPTGATSGHEPPTPLSSPTIEILKASREASNRDLAARTNSGPSAQILAATKAVNLQQLSFEELSTQLLKAVKNGDHRLVERVVEIATAKHWSIVNIRGMWESTPLIYACQYCHEKIALWLLQQGADVQSVNEKGVSALLLACLEGMATATQQMLERVATKASTNPTDALQSPRLPIDAHVGVVYNSVADVNVRANPLLAASMNGHEAVVALLLQHGASVNHGVPPLSASNNKSASASTTSGSACGRRIRQFPLLAAAKYGHAAVVDLLLEHGADIREMDGNDNHALLLACEAAKEGCALALLRFPTRTDLTVWKQANTHGFTALHYCAVHGLVEAAERMLRELQWENDLEFLNATSATRQESAVLMAARKKQIDMVKLLLQSGADAVLADRGATTALDVLKRDKRDELVRLWEELQAKTKRGAPAVEVDHEKGPVAGDAIQSVEAPESYVTLSQDKTVMVEEIPELAHPELQDGVHEPTRLTEELLEAGDQTGSTIDSPSRSEVLLEQEAGGAVSASCDCKAFAGVGVASLVVGVRPSPLELESTEGNGVQHETFDDADNFPSPACVDTIQEPVAQEEAHDLTPTALQQPHGRRSKSTPHNRRPTGFAVEPKAKAKSLSNASGSLVPQLEEMGEEEENEPAESNDPPTPTTGDPRHGGIAKERRIERREPDTRIANSSEKASISPDKPIEKQRKKKRHAKKNERSPRKAKTTVRHSSELDASPEEPTPSSSLSTCIPERGNAGDLDDDF